MKKSLILLTSIAAISFGVTALADVAVSGPLMMTNAELDSVVAARGRPGSVSQTGCCDYLSTPQSNFGNNAFPVAEAADGNGSGKGLDRAESEAGSDRVSFSPIPF